jgi:hypothetical protein
MNIALAWRAHMRWRLASGILAWRRQHRSLARRRGAWRVAHIGMPASA